MIQTKDLHWRKFRSINAPYLLAWIVILGEITRTLFAFYSGLWNLTGDIAMPGFIAWNAIEGLAITIPKLVWIWRVPKNSKVKNSIIKLMFSLLLVVATSLLIEIIFLFFRIPDYLRELVI